MVKRASFGKQDGQILLITLLVLSVAMTITLGLVSRGTTDTNITNQQEESNRAFNAAEAGIEEALLKGSSANGTTVALSGDVKYTTTVTNIGGGAAAYKFPNITKHGMTETVWLVNHDSSGNLDETGVFGIEDSIAVCWSAETDLPAMVVAIVYKAADGSYRIARGAYDPDAANRGDEFESMSTVGPYCSQTNDYKKSIKFSEFGLVSGDTPLLLRLRPVYADTWIAVDPGSIVMPTQAFLHDVTGQTGSRMTRRIIARQYFAAPSGLFDFAVYSQGGFSR